MRVAGYLLGIGLFATAGYFAWAWKKEAWPFRSPLLVACEDILIDRLKSPSSYKFSSYVENVRRVPLSEVRDRYVREVQVIGEGKKTDITSVVEKWMERDKKLGGIQNWEGVLSYEAVNGFGASIRSKSFCSYTGYDLNSGRLKDSVEVNGKTEFDALIDSIKS